MPRKIIDISVPLENDVAADSPGYTQGIPDAAAQVAEHGGTGGRGMKQAADPRRLKSGTVPKRTQQAGPTH
jgi:hypothetical protein